MRVSTSAADSSTKRYRHRRVHTCAACHPNGGVVGCVHSPVRPYQDNHELSWCAIQRAQALVYVPHARSMGITGTWRRYQKSAVRKLANESTHNSDEEGSKVQPYDVCSCTVLPLHAIVYFTPCCATARVYARRRGPMWFRVILESP